MVINLSARRRHYARTGRQAPRKRSRSSRRSAKSTGDKSFNYTVREVAPSTRTAVTAPVKISTTSNPKVESWWSIIDRRAFGGLLPGGKSPRQVRTISNARKAEEREAMYKQILKARQVNYDYKIAKEEMEAETKFLIQQAKEKQDLYQRTWYESMGIADSPQEDAYQQLLRQQAYLEQSTKLAEQTIPAYEKYKTQEPVLQEISSLNPLTVPGSKSSMTPILIIGVVVLLGVMLARK